MIVILILVICSELLQTSGHIFLKKTAMQLDPHALINKKWLKQLLSNNYTWRGVILILAGLGFWYYALSCDDLSMVYPLGSLQYVIALIASYLYLDEKIDRFKILGTCLVMAGISLMIYSAK